MTDTLTLIPASTLTPGTPIWLSRRIRGILGSRDRVVVVTTLPRPSGHASGSILFDAIEGDHRITVCTSPTSEFEAVKLASD